MTEVFFYIRKMSSASSLKLFHAPKVIPLQASWVIKARAFAKKVVKTTYYPDSHQTNLQKIELDHFLSKLGEEAVKQVFEDLGQAVIGPDYNVYQAKQKSWQSDLVVNSIALAVKTQSTSAAKRYSVSWIFQASSTRYDSILKHPEAWVCFVTYDQHQQSCSVYPPYQLKDLHFKEPKLEYLKSSKKAVYLEDLPITT
jgi:hypothetical protein